MCTGEINFNLNTKDFKKKRKSYTKKVKERGNL